MRIVVAVGGNALLERGESPDAEIQQRHIRVAVDALAPLARSDQLVVTHGNGPQVGLLARESAVVDYGDRQFGRDPRHRFARGYRHHSAGRILKHGSQIDQARRRRNDPVAQHTDGHAVGFHGQGRYPRRGNAKGIQCAKISGIFDQHRIAPLQVERRAERAGNHPASEVGGEDLRLLRELEDREHRHERGPLP